MGENTEEMRETLQEFYLAAKAKRDELGERGQSSERDAQIDRANDRLISIQEQYKSMTGSYYLL